MVLVTVITTLPPCEDKTLFDFVPIQPNPHLGPNCIVYPLDYASIKEGLQKGLQVLINLGQQDIKLQQGIVLGHYQKAPSEEIMITQEDIFGGGMGMNREKGELREVWWNRKKRMKVTDTHLKIVVCTEKLKHCIVL